MVLPLPAPARVPLLPTVVAPGAEPVTIIALVVVLLTAMLVLASAPLTDNVPALMVVLPV